ncbi:MarR family winged helix-turn-helix transcriptional regulator [Sphingomonas sp. XXL09]|uniref:MarR family winged helix-turn-helix transcriptional regulator n=1 Tax=Sphingomonas sp. XXL09 TaxID=3457787 RepID=UPI00406BCA5F
MPFYDESNYTPEQSLGYLVRRIHQLGTALLDPVFTAEGLTHAQWSAMMSIQFGRATSCVAIARDIAHDKGATTRLIDTLEERGFVVRTRAPDDRRTINLALTPTGTEVATRLLHQSMQLLNGWLDGWSQEEVATLIGQLQRLRDRMQAVADGTVGLPGFVTVRPEEAKA